MKKFFRVAALLCVALSVCLTGCTTKENVPGTEDDGGNGGNGGNNGGGENTPVVQAPDGTVDMGLPSGTFWCEANLGTDIDHTSGVKETWCDYDKDVKYCFGDDLSLLEAADDKATKALGENYHMPTLGEWAELLNPAYTTVKAGKQGGLDGFVVTSLKTGKSLFFPDDGTDCYWTATGSRDNVGDKDVYYGKAWCAVLHYYGSQMQSYFQGDEPCHVGDKQYYIRPVYGKRPVTATGVKMEKDKMEVLRGQGGTLKASVLPSSASQTVVWFFSGYTAPNLKGDFIVHFNKVERGYAVDGTNGHFAWTEIFPKFPSAQPEAVDLGLPSGTKWASFDVGATKPEESGFYFAWGETETKWSFREYTYKWQSGGKYSKYGKNDRFLEAADDPAAKLLGGAWRTPTREQLEELWTKTSMETVEQNGVKGKLVKGPNKKTIFLPFGGYVPGSNLQQYGEGFCYMSCECSSTDDQAFWTFCFDNDGGHMYLFYREDQGVCVRAVQPK